MKRMKKILCIVLMAVVVATGIGAVGTVDAQAQTGFKKQVTWDLQPGKKVATKVKISALKPYVTTHMKITKCKVTNAKKDGYKRATITFVTYSDYKLTSAQVHAIVNGSDFMTNGSWYTGEMYDAVVNTKTGRVITKSDKPKIISETWTAGPTRKVEDEDGCWVTLPAKHTCKLVIEYPKTDKTTCLVIGGCSSKAPSAGDLKFFDGKREFELTHWAKIGRKYNHAIMLKDLKTLN